MSETPRRTYPKLWAVYCNDGEWHFVDVALTRTKAAAIAIVRLKCARGLRERGKWTAREIQYPKLYSQTYGRLHELVST